MEVSSSGGEAVEEMTCLRSAHTLEYQICGQFRVH